jgi:hypothetical protein
MTRGWRGGWSRKPVVDGVYRLDESALLDEFFSFLHELGVVDLRDDVQGAAVQRALVPCVQDSPALPREDPVWDREHACLASPAVQ